LSENEEAEEKKPEKQNIEEKTENPNTDKQKTESQGSGKQDAKKKNSSKKKTWILVLIIIALAAVIAALAVYMLKNSQPEPGDYPSGYVSSWSVDIPDDIQEQIKSQSQEQIVAPGFGNMTMSAGSDTLKISIGNPSENHCYLKISVTMEDGTTLFESDLLKPGTGYTEIPLSKKLSAGQYNIIVHYQGYSMDDAQNELNSIESAFVLTVE